MRPITDSEITAFGTALTAGFGHDHKPEDEVRWRRYGSYLRNLAVFDGDQIVGTLGDFALRLTVPGGAQVPMAGTTMVTVRPTHRRQGLLRAMMHEHLQNAVDRGEPVAGLWASEAAIYGRFGYGLATELHEIRLNTKEVSIAPGSATVAEFITSDQLERLVAPFWSHMATMQAGFVDRESERWQSIAEDAEHRRHGASASRYVIAKRGGDVAGFLAFRQRPKWEDGGMANGTVQITELIAADIDAHRCLWNFATNIDLFPSVVYGNAPIDDTFALESSDPRAVRRVLGDALYLRILDLPVALAARTYERDGHLVIGVTDPLGYADGAFDLTVANGRAVIEPTAAEATVSMDIRELGALYLGRACAAQLARAEKIVGDAADVLLLGQIFQTAAAPWCSEDF